jgi:hypothetical protein
MILAIDPGPVLSAFVVWNDRVVDSGTVDNLVLKDFFHSRHEVIGADVMAIEMVACYGMAVGKEVFETCVWIGRFIEAWGREHRKVYRKDIKMHLCQSMRAKDGNIRQALIDKHGAVGTKKAPGKLYGISGHLWAALAVADYATDL